MSPELGLASTIYIEPFLMGSFLASISCWSYHVTLIYGNNYCTSLSVVYLVFLVSFG